MHHGVQVMLWIIVIKLVPLRRRHAEEDGSAELSQNLQLRRWRRLNRPWEAGLLLADDVLINGVGRREAEDERSHRNHDNG